MDELQEKVKQLAFGLKEIIECPVCFGTMDSNLRQCVNGHGICSTCATKIAKCPSCQQVLIIRQNNLLGKILECLPKPCLFTDKGCNTIVFDKEHETFCEFRPAECKHFSCDWRGCIKDLIIHVKACSKGTSVCKLSAFNVEHPGKYTFPKNHTIMCFTPIIYQNQLFWKHCHRDGLSKLITHKCYYVQTSKSRVNYYMCISFKKGNLEFKHCCKALTDIGNHSDSYTDRNGLLISDSEIENFLVAGSENQYEYTLKLVKGDLP